MDGRRAEARGYGLFRCSRLSRRKPLATLAVLIRKAAIIIGRPETITVIALRRRQRLLFAASRLWTLVVSAPFRTVRRRELLEQRRCALVIRDMADIWIGTATALAVNSWLQCMEPALKIASICRAMAVHAATPISSPSAASSPIRSATFKGARLPCRFSNIIAAPRST